MKYSTRVALLASLPLLLLAISVSYSPSYQVEAVILGPQSCKMCKTLSSFANYLLATNRGAKVVYGVTNTFCILARIESPEVCTSVTRLFNRYVTKVLSHGLVTPEKICGLLTWNTCGQFINPLSDWEINLEVSATLDHEQIAKMKAIDKERKKPHKNYRIIHISDTHVDWKYEVGSISNCDQPLCCRTGATKRSRGKKEKAGYWGTLSKCDIPLRTFESALKFIAKEMENSNDIPYIVWTGDIQPHDIWKQDKQSAIENYKKVFATIFNYLPDAKIFPTMGNHEMVPVDSFSPSSMKNISGQDAPDWLYKELDTYWSRWLPPDTVKTITKDGFYAVTVQPGLKIISLNTNFCHDKNFWLYINSTDPGNQLEWLIHELQISELEHEQVHIIGHIPPGTIDCLKAWSRNFNKIVRRFSKTITGQFYGHTHQDEFELLYDQDGSERHSVAKPWKPISTAFIAGSLTTFIGINPSFRIYTIDPNQNFLPINYETYYMDLNVANENPMKEPEWKSLGSFAQKFGINDTSPQSLHQLLVELASDLTKNDVNFPEVSSLDKLTYTLDCLSEPKTLDDVVESKLFSLFDLSNGYSNFFGKKVYQKTTNKERKAFLCKYFTGQSHNYNACNRFISASSMYM